MAINKNCFNSFGSCVEYSFISHKCTSVYTNLWRFTGCSNHIKSNEQLSTRIGIFLRTPAQIFHPDSDTSVKNSDRNRFFVSFTAKQPKMGTLNTVKKIDFVRENENDVFFLFVLNRHEA